jgi:hypothetical protein
MYEKQKAFAAWNKEHESAADWIKLPIATRQTVTQKNFRFQDSLKPTGLSFSLFSLSIAQHI